MSSLGRAAQLLAAVTEGSSDLQNPLSEPWWRSGKKFLLPLLVLFARGSSQGKTHPWQCTLLYLGQAQPNSPLDFSATFVANIYVFFPAQALPYIFIPTSMGVSRRRSASRAAPPTLPCLVPRLTGSPRFWEKVRPSPLQPPVAAQPLPDGAGLPGHRGKLEDPFQAARCPQVEMLQKGPSQAG